MKRTNLIAVVALLSLPALAQAAPDKVTSSLAVKGPIDLRLATIDGGVEISAGTAKKVTVTVKGASVKSVGLVRRGAKGIEVTFDGADRLREGRVHVEVPAGSGVELTTVSGDIRASGVNGDLRVKTVSGDVTVEKAAKVNVTAVSGDLELRSVSGAIRARTVSGDAVVKTTGRADAKLQFETTSGGLRWTGKCGKGGSIQVKTLSGDISLALDPASAFGLEFTSFSGELQDKLGVTVKRSKANRHGGVSVRAQYGKGGGTIEVESFSGELGLKKK